MTYYRVDDRWRDDPRLVGLPLSAFWAWHAMQAYCNPDLIDTIPPGVPFARFSPWAKPAAIAKDRATLIERGLIKETAEGGLRLVGWEEEQNLVGRRAEREYDRDRAREKRDREASARRPPVDRQTTAGQPRVDRRDSESRSQTQDRPNVRPDVRSLETETEGEAEAEQARRPSPSRKIVDRPATTAREEIVTDRRRRAAGLRRRSPDGDLAPLGLTDFGIVRPTPRASATTAEEASPDRSTLAERLAAATPDVPEYLADDDDADASCTERPP